MASGWGAGQYEDAFRPQRLQNWSVPRPCRKRPSLWEGSTPVITNDRGHLLPTVPRSQASPWGTFVGTWEMPSRIPPARLDLTSRSAAATARLLDQIHQPTTLTRACNGLWTEVTGKPQESRPDTQSTTEPSRRSGRASSSPRILATTHPAPREPSPQEAPAPSRGGSRGAEPPGSGHHLEWDRERQG